MKKKINAPYRGRILRVKNGFNPNSSSIASEIIVFFTAAAGVSALFSTAAAVVMARFSDQPEPAPDADRGQQNK
ncbi:MAG: hypothetical protein JXA18_09650 [Chitinispirillaceae bacterium]|nr:hypothetical protein [Chitinispirillaceae bacterium]